MPLSSSLIEKASACIRTDASLDESFNLEFRLIYNDDRQIYRADTPQSTDFYVLKVRGANAVKASDHDIDDLRKEFKLLNDAWKSAKQMQAGNSMSKPLALWEDERAMLLSGCEGKNLNDFFNQNLFKWALSISSLKQAVAHCGKWLGDYHQFSCRSDDLQASNENRSKHLKRMLNFLKGKSNSALDNHELSRIESRFMSLIKHCQTGNIGLVHGNFAYRNVLFSDDRTNLVDFEDAHREHAAYDMGQFMAEILFKSQFPWLRHQTQNLLNAFRSGYQQHSKIESKMLEAYIGYHLVVHLYEHSTRRTPKIPHRWLLNFRIHYLAQLLRKWLIDSE